MPCKKYVYQRCNDDYGNSEHCIVPRLDCIAWIVEGDECSNESSSDIAGDCDAALPTESAQPSCDEDELTLSGRNVD